MKKFWLFMLASAALTFTACSSDDDPTSEDGKLIIDEPDINVTRGVFEPIRFGNETQRLINQQLRGFSWKLFGETFKNRQSGDNLLISPFSLEVDLAMLMNGLGDNSLTELKKTMGVEDYSLEDINEYYQLMVKGMSQEDGFGVFKSANSFWYADDYTVKDAFSNVLTDTYKAYVKPVDFGSKNTVKLINEWCAKQTNNRIPKLLEQTSKQDLFHLINAIYFYGKWSWQFDPTNTEQAKFTTASGKKKNVNLMYKYGEMAYYEDDTQQRTTMSFENLAFNMMLILPKKGSSVEKAVESIQQTGITYDVEYRHRVKLWVPRFEVEYTEEHLAEALNSLNPSLNFGGLDIDVFTQKPKDAAASILQKTYIKVNEEGAEAAAVTDIGWSGANIDTREILEHEMRLDRPFVFAITESSTGTPVFIGYYGE